MEARAMMAIADCRYLHQTWNARHQLMYVIACNAFVLLCDVRSPNDGGDFVSRLYCLPLDTNTSTSIKAVLL